VPDLVLVPSSLRKGRAARRLCDAQGGLLLGPRVATVPSLAPGLLAGAGETRALLTPLAERLLALDCVVEAGLAGAKRPGGARAAAELVAELRRGEVASSDVRAAAAAAPARAAERLLAAAAALAAYEGRLERLHALDAAGALRAAAAAARRGTASPETCDLGLLVLEGFLPPWPAALDLVSALAARARAVVARVPYLPGDPRRSSPVEPWVKRVESWHELASRRDVSLSFPGGGRAPAIAHALGEERGDPAGIGRVLSLPAPGDREQAEGAARLAADLVEGGVAPEDIAVVAPRRLWTGLAGAFEGLSIPFSAPLDAPLSATAPFRHVRAAFSCAGGLTRGAAEVLLASPYLRLPGAPEGLARLLDRAGALEGRGDPEARVRARLDLLAPGPATLRERAELARTARSLEHLRRTITPFGTAARPKAWAARVRAFLDRAGARRRAARGEAELARRDLAAMSRMEDLADELAGALALAGRGDALLAPGEWAELLDLAAASASVPGAPAPASGAVELWPLEEAPGLDARAVLVLGAERGSWPPPPRADPVLGDAGRAALNDHLGRRAVPTAAARQIEAEFLGVSALAAAREVLAVGFTRSPDGVGAAALAAEALARAGAPALALAEDPPLDRARSLAEAVRAAARRAAAGGGGVLSAGGSAALARRAESAAARGALELERRTSCADGRASPASGALPADLSRLWAAALPAEWSASQLETHARCAYRFFLQVVGVADEDPAELDISPRDEGRLMHAVLEAFLSERRMRGAWPVRGGEEDRAEVGRAASRVFARFEAEGRVGDLEAFRARRPAFVRRLERWVEAEARDYDGLAPALVEHAFGGRSRSPPVELRGPDGPILLRGRIDRVDADARRLRVIDYKNARGASEHRRRLGAEELGSTSFQPPLYLLAAAGALPGRTAYEFTYGLLRAGERVDPWRSGPDDPFLDPTGGAQDGSAAPRSFAEAVGARVARIRSGSLPVASEDCTGCPFGAVCRFPRPGDEA